MQIQFEKLSFKATGINDWELLQLIDLFQLLKN